MKKYLSIILITISLVSFVTGCNKRPEYYSVRFNADNTLVWVDEFGGYTGHWAMNGKKITLSFDGGPGKITADVTTDNELLNI